MTNINGCKSRVPGFPQELYPEYTVLKQAEDCDISLVVA